jgi:XTP/dITP diphosphohydrolase
MGADADAAAPAFADEGELGDLLLGIVAAARARGLDAERALRTRLRALAADVQAVEGSSGRVE